MKSIALSFPTPLRRPANVELPLKRSGRSPNPAEPWVFADYLGTSSVLSSSSALSAIRHFADKDLSRQASVELSVSLSKKDEHADWQNGSEGCRSNSFKELISSTRSIGLVQITKHVEAKACLVKVTDTMPLSELDGGENSPAERNHDTEASSGEEHRGKLDLRTRSVGCSLNAD
eukprot:CAMPEP_0196740164 /NCGR_PEP_ID=MMETSP1091-20130531/29462_1 /TAXON_ID=302021 /ORGANISM="Rhodomonas sp., Strain CCMP768" /LENGTH=174 /DNA_ID=CAMNT_0042085147 /DNA_START=8 /DNA_END=532 /DNA_ORIENTATION=-